MRLRASSGLKRMSYALATWAEDHDIELQFFQPGKQTQNAHIERFNGTYRTETMDCYVFETLAEVRPMTVGWFTAITMGGRTSHWVTCHRVITV